MKMDFTSFLQQLQSQLDIAEAKKTSAPAGQLLRRSVPPPSDYRITEEELNAECVDAVLQFLYASLGNIYGELQKQLPFVHLLRFVQLFLKSDLVFEALKMATVDSDKGSHMYSSASINTFLPATLKRFVQQMCLQPPDIILNVPITPPFNLFTAATTKNQRRKMEDRLVCVPDVHLLFPHVESGVSFFGVFDGHRGSEGSDYAAAHFLPNVINSDHFGTDHLAALTDACRQTDENFQRRSIAQNYSCGTTCIGVIVTKKHIEIVCVGDSQVVLATSSYASCVTTLHNTSNQAERERIVGLGGFILETNGMARVNGMLAVTRSLGDFSLRPYVTAEPEVLRHERTGAEEFLVLGTDGAFESVSAELCAEKVRRWIKEGKDPFRCAEGLVDLAKEKGSQDNISVVVVFLKPLETLRQSC